MKPAKTVQEFGYFEDENKWRGYMEDKSDYRDGLESDPSLGIWGIYDGHLGSGMATLVK